MSDVEMCHACGGTAIAVREPVEIRLGRRRETVVADRWRCMECGEVFYTGGQIEAAQRLAAAQLRTKTEVLSGAEIRDIRESLGLSQPAFERLVQAGAKTVVRWERGMVVPNSTANLLLLSIRDVPGMAEYLAQRHEVELHRRSVMDVFIKKVVWYSDPGKGAPQPAANIEEVPEAVRRRSTSPAIPDDPTLNEVFVSPGQVAPSTMTTMSAPVTTTVDNGEV